VTMRRRCEDATEHFDFPFIQIDGVDSHSNSCKTANWLQQSAAAAAVAAAAVASAAVASAALLSGQGTNDELYRTAGCGRRASILLPAR
jgi:hypothetical protein